MSAAPKPPAAVYLDGRAAPALHPACTGPACIFCAIAAASPDDADRSTSITGLMRRAMERQSKSLKTQADRIADLSRERNAAVNALKLAVKWMPCAEVRNWPPGFRLREEAMKAASDAISMATGPHDYIGAGFECSVCGLRQRNEIHGPAVSR